nr:histidine kinase dimerization/phospho-acceptor domain-containing protein [Sphingomonas sp. H160509]
MGQLTGGVAHDFNNLLTPILAALDMLQRRGVGGDREQRLIEGAIQSVDRAATLVQRLLAFARRQPLQSSAVDIGKLVAGMADLLISTTGPQVRVVVDLADDLPPRQSRSKPAGDGAAEPRRECARRYAPGRHAPDNRKSR